MKVCVKKEICESREQCMGPTESAEMHFFQKEKKIKRRKRKRWKHVKHSIQTLLKLYNYSAQHK